MGWPGTSGKLLALFAVLGYSNSMKDLGDHAHIIVQFTVQVTALCSASDCKVQCSVYCSVQATEKYNVVQATAVYGIRRYRRGSVLHTHLDR